MEKTKEYAKGLLQMSTTVSVLNDICDAERIDDLFNLSIDETDEHRILSIYEVLGGTCLVSARFDKETGEITKTDDEYVYDRFGDYVDKDALKILDDLDGSLTIDVICLTAGIAALTFTGSKELLEKFKSAVLAN